jgi:hypothetical protein
VRPGIGVATFSKGTRETGFFSSANGARLALRNDSGSRNTIVRRGSAKFVHFSFVNSFAPRILAGRGAPGRVPENPAVTKKPRRLDQPGSTLCVVGEAG